jgi:hypothetical protein
MNRPTIVTVLLLGLGVAALPARAEGAPKVTLRRVPGGGIQPQVAVDGKGTVHLIYFKGTPGTGDVFYVRSTKTPGKFTRPVRVNSQRGSAIAVGNIRGAHLALGKNGRPHVAWNGSGKAEPKAPGKSTPMLYTRLKDDGTGFEPQRNLMRFAGILDGGGSVAADGAGNVYVTWHSPPADARGEGVRRVWVARSRDEGKTFSAAKAPFKEATGACGCCGMRAFADSRGNLYALYRSARLGVHRDNWLLTSTDRGVTFKGENVGKWNIGTCPMSSASFAQSPAGVLASWETKGQVGYAVIDPKTGKRSAEVQAPGTGGNRKHSVVAGNKAGEVILVWTEGMGWERGGSVAWQVYDKKGKPTKERGKASGVPTWSLVAVYARPDGGFTILY